MLVVWQIIYGQCVTLVLQEQIVRKRSQVQGEATKTLRKLS